MLSSRQISTAVVSGVLRSETLEPIDMAAVRSKRRRVGFPDPEPVTRI